MNIVIINAHSSLNKGDAGIVAGLCQGLRNMLPECRLTVSSFDPVRDERAYRRWGNISTLPPLLPIPPKDAHVIRRCLILLADVLAMPFCSSALITDLRKADLVVSCGGGFLYSYSRVIPEVTFLIHAATLYLAGWLNRRLVIAPQSIGPFRSPLARFIAIRAVRRAKEVIIREPESLALVQAAGLNRARLALDIGFYLKATADDIAFARQTLERYRGKKAAVTVRKWQQGEARAGYLASMAGMVLDLVDAGYTVFVVPQVIGPGEEEDDRDISRELVARCAPALPVRYLHEAEEADPAQLVALYGMMDLVVATRMHSAIFALSQQVPTVCIAYQPKGTGLYRLLGLERQCIEIGRLSGAALTDAITAAVSGQPVIDVNSYASFFSIIEGVISEHSSDQ